MVQAISSLTRPAPIPPAQINAQLSRVPRYGLTPKHAQQNQPTKADSDFRPWIPRTIQPDLLGPWKLPQAIKRFVVIGDAGAHNTNQMVIAEQLKRTFEKTPFASVLTVGDNVYPNGEPKWFNAAIAQPYGELMHAGVKFFPTMGNHDVRQGYTPLQLEYWGVPSYYNFSITPQVECFALDTTLLLPDYARTHTDNPRLAKLKGYQQLQWLQTALANSKAPIKLVYGHYPMYTSNEEGLKQQASLKLRQQLEPLFIRYGVSAYLAGDDHDYAASMPIKGVRYFITGGGGSHLDKVNPTPFYPRRTAISDHHFMVFDILPQGLLFQTINKEGQRVDKGFIPPNTATYSPVSQTQFY